MGSISAQAGCNGLSIHHSACGTHKAPVNTKECAEKHHLGNSHSAGLPGASSEAINKDIATEQSWEQQNVHNPLHSSLIVLEIVLM